MSRSALTPLERTIATSAGAASVVLMLVVWFVLPRLQAAAFAPDDVLPLPVRVFQACYPVWPLVLFATAAIGVLLNSLDPRGGWRRAMLVVDAAMALLAIVLIGLGAVSAYITIAMLPARVAAGG